MTRFTPFFIILWLSLPGIAAPTVFNIRDYGATGQKTDDATVAIERTIAAARQVGGGVVQVPPGNYTCLHIDLYDNITLQIDAGAVLFVDVANPAFVNNSGFIYAERASNITIRGRGQIDGQATYQWADYTTTDAEIDIEVAIARKAGIAMKRSYRTGKAAYTLLFRECEDVVIEGVTLVNSSLWAARLWGCNRVRFRAVTIRSDLEMGVNSDGIDLDGTSNAHVSGCTISTGDDAICLKTGRWNSSEEKTYPTENIIVSDCILTSSSAALKIGSETRAPIRHVFFTNCVIRDANRGISINVQDGATVSDVTFSNLTMDLRRRHWNWWGSADAFYFVLKKRTPDSPVGSIKNITIDNVTAYAQGTSRAITTVDQPIENLRIRNLQLFMEPEATPDKRTANALLFSGIDGLILDNVSVHWNDEQPEPVWQHALVMERVSNFRLRDVSARQAQPVATTSALLLTDCRNGIISECTAQPGTGTFSRITGANTRDLTVHTNFLKNARIPLALDKTIPKNTVLYKPFP